MYVSIYAMDAHECVSVYVCVCAWLIESGEASRFMGAVWIAQCGPVQLVHEVKLFMQNEQKRIEKHREK